MQFDLYKLPYRPCLSMNLDQGKLLHVLSFICNLQSIRILFSATVVVAAFLSKDSEYHCTDTYVRSQKYALANQYPVPRMEGFSVSSLFLF